jgi:hypothetical protein
MHDGSRSLNGYITLFAAGCDSRSGDEVMSLDVSCVRRAADQAGQYRDRGDGRRHSIDSADHSRWYVVETRTRYDHDQYCP